MSIHPVIHIIKPGVTPTWQREILLPNYNPGRVFAITNPAFHLTKTTQKLIGRLPEVELKPAMTLCFSIDPLSKLLGINRGKSRSTVKRRLAAAGFGLCPPRAIFSILSDNASGLRRYLVSVRAPLVLVYMDPLHDESLMDHEFVLQVQRDGTLVLDAPCSMPDDHISHKTRILYVADMK